MQSCIPAINEFVNLDLIRSSLTSGCHVVRYWTLITGTVSQALLTFNSSVNFLMYPAISKDFRTVFKQYIRVKFHFIPDLLHYWKGNVNRSSSEHSDVSNRDTIPSSNYLSPSDDTPDEEAPNDPSMSLVELESHQNEPNPKMKTISSILSSPLDSSSCQVVCVKLIHSGLINEVVRSKSVGSLGHLAIKNTTNRKENHLDEATARCWISPCRRFSSLDHST